MTPQIAGMKNNGNAIWSTPPEPFGIQKGITAKIRAVSAKAHGPASSARSQGCQRLRSHTLESDVAKRCTSPQKLNVVDIR